MGVSSSNMTGVNIPELDTRRRDQLNARTGKYKGTVTDYVSLELCQHLMQSTDIFSQSI